MKPEAKDVLHLYLKQWVQKQIEQLKVELSQYKDAIKSRNIIQEELERELSQAREENERINSVFTEQSYELQDLKSTLSQEKAKAFDKSDMIKAYEYGQEDCGEFGAVIGFESWFQEKYTPKDQTQKK